MHNVILLTDKNSNSWNFAKRIQKYIEEEKECAVNLEEVEIGHFGNGETKIHVPENMRMKDVYFVHDSTKNPQDWWVELILLKDLLNRASVGSVSFILPNMLYSRQDRKDKPHVPISASALACSISPGLERIITMDLHAPQIQGFYPENVPLDNLHSFPTTVRYLRENHLGNLDNLVIISPDAGGVHRAQSFFKRLEKAKEEFNEEKEYSQAFISKTRSKSGTVEKMELVGDVCNKNVLIVDDMIDTGGTLLNASKLLKNKGAKKLMCYGTHGIFTKGTKEICANFDVVMTSNTHYGKNKGVEIIDVSPLFAEAIYRAQKGYSISKLFE